jgi:hypothetical protein
MLSRENARTIQRGEAVVADVEELQAEGLRLGRRRYLVTIIVRKRFCVVLDMFRQRQVT